LRGTSEFIEGDIHISIPLKQNVGRGGTYRSEEMTRLFEKNLMSGHSLSRPPTKLLRAPMESRPMYDYHSASMSYL